MRRSQGWRAWPLYAWYVADDAILFYPLYAIYFAHAGLSTSTISLLLIVWSVSAAALQIPTGWLSDVVRRPPLLAVGALARALAFVVWIVQPTFGGFLVGFLLWGLKSALTMGTVQAIVYDELTDRGQVDRYVRVMARASGLRAAGSIVAIAASAKVVDEFGMTGIGIGSAAVCALQSVVALAFPWRKIAVKGPRGVKWLVIALRGVWDRRDLRLAMLIVVPGLAMLSIDEYFQLFVVHETGAVLSEVSLVTLLPVILGIALTWGYSRMRRSASVWYMAVPCSISMVLGAAIGSWAGVVLLGVSIGLYQIVLVCLDAEVQHITARDGRATVTSVRQLAAEGGTLLMFGTVALATGAGGSISEAILILGVLGVVVSVYGAVSLRPRFRHAGVDARSETHNRGTSKS